MLNQFYEYIKLFKSNKVNIFRSCVPAVNPLLIRQKDVIVTEIKKRKVLVSYV